MKTNGQCPVRGKISVEKNVSVSSSAPIGAGESLHAHVFYRAFAPDGTVYQCPVRGSISVEKKIMCGCSAPIGAVESSAESPFYRHFTPNGVVQHINQLKP